MTTPLHKRIFYSTLARKMLTWLATAYVKMLSWTVRYKIEGLEEVEAFLRDRNHPPCMFALWHNRQILTYPLYRKAFGYAPCAILISKSRDGNIPADYALAQTNTEVIRVGHQARHEALLRLLAALEHKKVVILTPDGPRGPLYEIKPGIVFLARKSGAAVIALSWTASSTTEFSSWDRFQLPRPFAKITARFSKPILFPEDGDEKSFKATLEAALG